MIIVLLRVNLKFQEAILSKVANIFNTTYRLSPPEDESKGIDGYIGDLPISIKPVTYKLKKSLDEKINIKIIYYNKEENGLKIDLGEMI